MWELNYKESWVLKNWCFWTVVLEKTLESPLDCKEIQPVHPKGISPGCSLEGLMLKLKLQYFGHLMRRTDSFEKTLMLGKIEGRRRRGWQRMKWLMASLTQWTRIWVNPRSWWWTGRPAVLHSMGLQRVGHDWATELNWAIRWNPGKGHRGLSVIVKKTFCKGQETWTLIDRLPEKHYSPSEPSSGPATGEYGMQLGHGTSAHQSQFKQEVSRGQMGWWFGMQTAEKSIE